MVKITLEVPEGALAALRKDAVAFGSELRLAAAVKWYEQAQISQGKAAEIAGLSRAEFVDALGRYKVSPFQVSAEDLQRELACG